MYDINGCRRTVCIINDVEIGAPMFKIILCDDNRTFLENLRREIRTILRKGRTDSVIYTFSNFEEIPSELLSQANIFFLDIDFAGQQYTGIDIAKKIRTLNEKSIIIFVTNFIQYAPDGYEVQAFRYLLKSDISSKLELCLHQALDKLSLGNETIMLNIYGETILIPIADVLYIESQAHNVIVYVQPQGQNMRKEYRMYSTLGSMEKNLEKQGFLRIQKSYLVNIRRMTKYQCTEAVLDTGLSLKVSKKIYNEQKRKYLLWKSGKNV